MRILFAFDSFTEDIGFKISSTASRRLLLESCLELVVELFIVDRRSYCMPISSQSGDYLMILYLPRTAVPRLVEGHE